MDFEPIPRELVSDKIIQQVREKINAREFKPGALLPSEIEMARSFKVGRSTVREALKVLVYIGILERKGRHTFVASRPINSGMIVRGLTRYRDYQDVVDLIEVRRLLETQICEFAAERADDTDIKELKASIREMPTDVKAIGSFIESDKKFHLLLAKASKNRILLKMMENIRKSLNVEVVTRHNPDIIPRSVQYHEEIFKAIARHQPRKARRAIKNHLQDIENEFKAVLRSK